MFHDMRTSILQRMKELEEIDAADRGDGTPRMQRLRQIPPDTGKFIALLAATAPAGTYIEVGTSAGYSSLWLALHAISLDGTSSLLKSYQKRLDLPAKHSRGRGSNIWYSSLNQTLGDVSTHTRISRSAFSTLKRRCTQNATN